MRRPERRFLFVSAVLVGIAGPGTHAKELSVVRLLQQGRRYQLRLFAR